MKMEQHQYTVSSDKSLLDVPYIHQNLSQSYWAAGIPLETVQKSIDGALCFGIYKEGKQLGFARLITDEATFAYLADVFVDENHRGQGLGKMLMNHIMALEFMPKLRNTLLGTRDAHSLYSQYGFKPLKIPERFMQILRPNIYQKSE
jgi:GNAT superfamily N-acetyltransferase